MTEKIETRENDLNELIDAVWNFEELDTRTEAYAHSLSRMDSNQRFIHRPGLEHFESERDGARKRMRTAIEKLYGQKLPPRLGERPERQGVRPEPPAEAPPAERADIDTVLRELRDLSDQIDREPEPGMRRPFVWTGPRRVGYCGKVVGLGGRGETMMSVETDAVGAAAALALNYLPVLLDMARALKEKM